MIVGDWVDDAACKNERPDDFFSDDKAAIARAAAFCLRCTVREQCLELAIRTNTVDGRFGGLTPRERRNLADLRVKPGAPRQPDLINRQVKDCPTCNRPLDRADFSVQPARSDGLSGECKACRQERRKAAKKAASRERTCLRCAQKFTPAEKDRIGKYCSKQCSNAAYRARTRRKQAS